MNGNDSRDGLGKAGMPPESMTVLEAAGWWWVRHDAGDLASDARAREAFRRWLAGSEARREAWARVGAASDGFEASADADELRALREEVRSAYPPVAAGHRGGAGPGSAPRRQWRGQALAASVAVAALGTAALLGWRLQDPMSGSAPVAATLDADAPGAIAPSAEPGTLRRSAAEYVTAPNQSSTVTLPDGTRVSMNLDTAFRVDYDALQRRVHFSRGQAFFDVAKDAARPFVVVAADQRIRALGTQFEVNLLDPRRLEVVLLEGRVSVERDRHALVDRLVRRTAPVELEPDQRLLVRADALPVISPVDAYRATSWREGWIVFEDETVREAIEELNRYSQRPLVAADDGVGRMRLSGVFRIGQPKRFASIIQELLPVDVHQGAQGETVLSRRAEHASRTSGQVSRRIE